MTSRDFCFWLQGYFEIHNANMPENIKASQAGLTNHQIEVIQRHLNLVFKHEIDPSMGGPEKQEELNKVHSGTPVALEELYALLDAERPKLKAELEEVIKKYAVPAHMRPGSDPTLRC